MSSPLPLAIEAEGLGKLYRVYSHPYRRVLETLTGGRFVGHRPFWALRGIDLRLPRGMAMGLCGANGSGKSTLLRLLSGSTFPSEGRFRTAGRVSSLLDLTTGFRLDLSGRSNVMLQGILMGYTRREMLRKLDEIVEFSELGGFIDEPLRNYSSGMGMRLGFSLAMSADPDSLLLDEVFAVGDAAFQRKCVERIFELKHANCSILFCSHSLYDLRQLCDEALWLRRGTCGAIGDVVAVTEEYNRYSVEHMEFLAGAPEQPAPSRADLPCVVAAGVYRPGGEEPVLELSTGDSVEIRIWWRNPSAEGLPFHLLTGFRRQDLVVCCAFATHLDGIRLSGREGCVVLSVPDLHLLEGRFLIPVWVLDERGLNRYQEYILPEPVVVRAGREQLGVFHPPHTWQHRASAAPEESRIPG